MPRSLGYTCSSSSSSSVWHWWHNQSPTIYRSLVVVCNRIRASAAAAAAAAAIKAAHRLMMTIWFGPLAIVHTTAEVLTTDCLLCSGTGTTIHFDCLPACLPMCVGVFALALIRQADEQHQQWQLLLLVFGSGRRIGARLVFSPSLSLSFSFHLMLPRIVYCQCSNCLFAGFCPPPIF